MEEAIEVTETWRKRDEKYEDKEEELKTRFKLTRKAGVF